MELEIVPPIGALMAAARGSTELAAAPALAKDTLWALQKSGTLERDSVAGQPDRRQEARWGHLQSGEQ